MRTNRRTMLKRTAAAGLCAAFLLPMALPAAVYAGDVPAGAQTGMPAGAQAGTQAGAKPGAGRTLARIQLSVGDGQETPVFRAGEKVKLQDQRKKYRKYGCAECTDRSGHKVGG